MEYGSCPICKQSQDPSGARLSTSWEAWRDGCGDGFEIDISTSWGQGEVVSESGLARAKRGRIDAVVVGGGDGTMLHAAQATMGWGIPLLGINLGSLGFLTSVKAGEVGTVLPEILRGRFGVSSRTVLSVKLSGGRQEWSALNEVSVGPPSGAADGEGPSQGGRRNVVGVSCGWVAGSEPDGFDGVFLVGRWTASKPAARAMVLTPVCAHAMAQRLWWWGEQEGGELWLSQGEPSAVVRLDGKKIGKLSRGSCLRGSGATRGEVDASGGFGFYGLTRQKLGLERCGGSRAMKLAELLQPAHILLDLNETKRTVAIHRVAAYWKRMKE